MYHNHGDEDSAEQPDDLETPEQRSLVQKYLNLVWSWQTQRGGGKQDVHDVIAKEDLEQLEQYVAYIKKEEAGGVEYLENSAPVEKADKDLGLNEVGRAMAASVEDMDTLHDVACATSSSAITEEGVDSKATADARMETDLEENDGLDDFDATENDVTDGDGDEINEKYSLLIVDGMRENTFNLVVNEEYSFGAEKTGWV